MGCLNDWEIVQLGPDSYREGNCSKIYSVASSIFTVLSEANSDRHPDRTTGWSSTINTFVADLLVFCINPSPSGLNRPLAIF